MYFVNSRAVPAALWSLMAATAIATYDATAKTNVALYYGQGPNEATTYGLAHFCASSSVDIIPLAFMNKYPSQGNGYPGTNFGGSCWGGSYVYSGPGPNPSLNDLQAKCPSLVSAIPDCQTMYGKKILLSLGGYVPSGQTAYQLMSVQDGEDLADFLWGAFGPLTASWTAANLPRPFDTEGTVNEVDGFDFDIEVTTPGEQAYYVALLKRLRSHFPTGPGCKEYIISGAPQCLTPDSNMAKMITTTQFDVIWTQYYNTPQCSARNWINNNPDYSSTLKEKPSGFKSNYDAFVQSLQGTPSENAMLYLGLLGSPSAGTSTDYLDPDCEVKPLIQAHYCNKNFGGVMIWEAMYATNITENQNTFYEEVKAILLDANTLSCPNGATSSTSSSTVVASTSSSTAPPSSSTPCSTTSSSTSKSSLATSSSVSSSTALSTLSTIHSTSSSSTSTSSSTTPSSSSKPCSTTSSSTSASSSTGSSSVSTSSSTTLSGTIISSGTGSSTYPSNSLSSSVGPSSRSSSSSSPATSLSSTSYQYPQGSNSSSIARSTSSVAGPTGTSTVSSTGSSIGSSTGGSIGSSTGSSTSGPSTTSAYSSIGPYNNSTSTIAYHSPASSSVAVSSSASLTTITTTTTSVYTITSCPPVVTNCPIGKVTTDIITITTTFCPASAGSTAAPVTTSYTTSTAAPVTTPYTTSTIYTTLVYTVTSCAPTVTNCPAKLGHVTTETVALYTTVCPVAAINTPSPVQAIQVSLESTSTVSQTTMQTVAITVPMGGVAHGAESTVVQTRVVSVVPLPVATPSYVTKVGAGSSVESTVSVIPLPVATPSYATNGGPSYATIVGAASPSGAACGTAGCASPTNSAIVPFKGGASKARLGAAGLASVVLVMAGMLML